MIPFRLYQKVYLVTAVIVLIFVALGFYASNLVMRSMAPSIETNRAAFQARLVDRLNPADRIAGLKEALRLSGPRGPTSSRYMLLNAEGNVIYPEGAENPLPDWKTVELPKNPYDMTTLRGEEGNQQGPHSYLVKFKGEPIQYLYMNWDGPPRRAPIFFLVSVSLVIASMLIGVGVSLLLIFRVLREKVSLADRVLAELQRGNLKARFPIRKMDELGEAMSRFNRMADEIENLVEQLRSVDKGRIRLLQELAHDLRTPIASLKNLLETLNTDKIVQNPHLKTELMGLAIKEVEYFERLVEDLLILAQVSEPRHHVRQQLVELDALFVDEAESSTANWNASHPRAIRLNKVDIAQGLLVEGDAHLLKRMIRNALENALSFAHDEVRITLQRDGKDAVMTIEDNGVGFSEESLASYGVRRVSRVLDSHHKGRLSVGLGSVILKTIATGHQGSVEVSNRRVEGHVFGASVAISLPLAQN